MEELGGEVDRRGGNAGGAVLLCGGAWHAGGESTIYDVQ